MTLLPKIDHVLPEPDRMDVTEAWCKRIREIGRARAVGDRAKRLFSMSRADMRIRAEKLTTLSFRLEQMADVAFRRVLTAKYGSRVKIEVSDKNLTWHVKVWPAYKPELAATYRFSKSTRLPVRNPRTAASLLKQHGLR